MRKKMKRHIPHAQCCALKHLFADSLLPKWYLHSNMFCFSSKMFTNTGTVGTVVKDPQDLCIISVWKNVSYFSCGPNVMHSCYCLEGCTVAENHEVAAHRSQYNCHSTNITVFLLAACWSLSLCHHVGGGVRELPHARYPGEGTHPPLTTDRKEGRRCASRDRRLDVTLNRETMAVCVKARSFLPRRIKFCDRATLVKCASHNAHISRAEQRNNRIRKLP